MVKILQAGGEPEGDPPPRRERLIGPAEKHVLELVANANRRLQLTNGREPGPYTFAADLVRGLAESLDRIEFRIMKLAGEEPTVNRPPQRGELPPTGGEGKG